MNNPGCAALAVMFAVASLRSALCEEPSSNPGAAAANNKAAAAARLSVEEARRQAEVLHTAMHSTIQIVHHQYYREDQGLQLPAAILKDVFAEIEQEQQIKLRWLVVEGQAMNVDHKPQDAFETEAVKALKAGKRSFERVEGGVYRHASPITLKNECLKCHVPDRKSTNDRTAGLIIAIPITEPAQNPPRTDSN